MRDLCPSDSNSTRTEFDPGLISTSKPGFGVAHIISTTALENEIAVVPPTRLNVRTCVAAEVGGAAVVVAAVVVVDVDDA